MYNLIVGLKKLIVEAGKIALQIRCSGVIVDYKEDGSPVTNADQAISDFIYEGLKFLTPNITVICEERIKQKDAGDIFWLVDPIDGTKSFIRGEDTYTVNIALIKYGHPVLGLIYQPSTNILYYTDGNYKLCVEKDNEVHIVASDRWVDEYEYIALVGTSNLDRKTSIFLQDHGVHKILPLASSIKLCLIAVGSADIYPKFAQTMAWDIAAGHALIIASGGKITNTDGEQLVYGKDNFQNPHFIAYGKHWLARYATNN